ncbi:hypothetical protein, partial [Ruthenibacterium lactatiformans]|uniref:hypothetical protein n=1 Tax=Ruthenibacterium lactatiformans TaxID=1550024 RepID=UPI001FC84B5D
MVDIFHYPFPLYRLFFCPANRVWGHARALTLADLACTLLSILFAILVWLRRKKDGGEDANDEDEQVDEDVEEDEPRGYAVQKTVNAVLAVLS